MINMIPSGYVKIAIENGHLLWIFPLKMVIFHSYVELPEDYVQDEFMSIGLCDDTRLSCHGI